MGRPGVTVVREDTDYGDDEVAIDVDPEYGVPVVDVNSLPNSSRKRAKVIVKRKARKWKTPSTPKARAKQGLEPLSYYHRKRRTYLNQGRSEADANAMAKADSEAKKEKEKSSRGRSKSRSASQPRARSKSKSKSRSKSRSRSRGRSQTNPEINASQYRPIEFKTPSGNKARAKLGLKPLSYYQKKYRLYIKAGYSPAEAKLGAQGDSNDKRAAAGKSKIKYNKPKLVYGVLGSTSRSRRNIAGMKVLSKRRPSGLTNRKVVYKKNGKYVGQGVDYDLEPIRVLLPSGEKTKRLAFFRE